MFERSRVQIPDKILSLIRVNNKVNVVSNSLKCGFKVIFHDEITTYHNFVQQQCKH